MSERVLKYNNKLLRFNNDYLRRNDTSSGGGFPTTNLVSYYSFDNVSGTTIYDDYGSRNITASTSSILGSSGYNNNGLIFNIDAYVDMGINAYDWFGGNDFSVSFWVKATPNARSAFFSDYNGGFGIKIGEISSKLETYVYPDNYRINVDSIFSTEKWQHLVFTMDSDSYYKVYIDGNLVDGMQAAPIGDSASTIKLGTRGDLYSFDYMRGYIDELSIWDTALSTTIIEQLYNNGDGLFYE